MPRLQQILIALTVVARMAAAQDPMPGVDLPTDGRGPINTRVHGLVAIPVVLSTPALGTGAGGAVAWQFQLDSSRSSAVGLGAIYSTSNSWMFGVGSRVLFHGSRREGVGGLAIFDAH